MCGFAGIVAWEDRFRTDRETLRKMSARIAHRGPDGEGLWLNHEAEVTPGRPQCGLAFRRLAILDPDPRAMQPFTIGRKTLVFNGEIYNFRELRAELTQIRPDYAWRTTGDTEVLLLAYEVWSEKCVERLNGMFAFAVWDEEAKSLFLARDRMGQKPLYVASTGGEDCHEPLNSVVFGSELPSTSVLPWLRNDPDLRSLLAYLKWGYTSTAHKRISEMPPGTCWTYSGPLSGRSRRYFEPDDRHRPPSRPSGDVVGNTRGHIRRAVAAQLVADVPIGCFLSGGMDSSVIASAMKHAAGEAEIHTFSIGFDDPRYDEREYARAVAAHIGTRHHEFVVRPDAAADLIKLATVWGVAFADSSALPTYYLARETRQHVKVALSGDGGDELFGGYDRYRAMAAMARVERAPKPVRRIIASRWWQSLPGVHPKSKLARVKRLAASANVSAAQRYSSYLRFFDDQTLGDLVTGELAEWHRADSSSQRRDWITRVYEFFEQHRDAVEAALATDRAEYLPRDLLTKVDRASMLHGLEVRSPFMDHELVQFAAGLTSDQLLKGGPKRMLREAFADDLPAWVFKRRKMGFAVPIGDWFRGELRPMLRDHLFAADSFARQHFQMGVVQRLVDEHESQRQDHSQRLYALLMLELWWRTCR